MFSGSCAWKWFVGLHFESDSVCFTEFGHVNHRQNSPVRCQLEIAWSRPPEGCYKINIDGSHIGGGGSACGGLMCCAGGSFVRGFSCKLGSGDTL